MGEPHKKRNEDPLKVSQQNKAQISRLNLLGRTSPYGQPLARILQD